MNIRTKVHVDIRELLEVAIYELYQERDALRNEARENILKIQQENKNSYDGNRVPEYKLDVFVVHKTYTILIWFEVETQVFRTI